jgi:hypothetical protein
MNTIQDVNNALAELREGLRADGYDLSVDTSRSDVVAVSVVAGPDACAECLVSKELMASMIEAALPGDFAGAQIDLRYPTD